MEEFGGRCERPGCDGVMVPRRGKFGLFWGCSNWQPSKTVDGVESEGCKFTKRVRQLSKTHSFVVLEAESVHEFWLYLRTRVPPTQRKRQREKSAQPPRQRDSQRRRTTGEKSTGASPNVNATPDCPSQQAPAPAQGRWITALSRAAKSPNPGAPLDLRNPVASAGGVEESHYSVESLVAASGLRPLRMDSRPAGAWGAIFRMREYELVQSTLVQVLAASTDYTLLPIPPSTLQALRGCASAAVTCGDSSGGGGGGEDEARWEAISDRVPRRLRACLLPYQIEGVEFVCACGGRALIADDMGLGKTLQALASAAALDAFPLLIVCPATLRLVWAHECEKWLPQHAAVGKLHVIFGHGDVLPIDATPSIVIVSYHMLRALEARLLAARWEMVIFDESHSIRVTKWPGESELTRAALAMASRVPRAVLLSGTPSLTRPFGLFHQVDALCPGLLGPTKLHFAMAYCPGGHGALWREGRARRGEGRASLAEGASSRPWELNLLLRSTVMLRRLKQHVLAQLPPKIRQLVPICIHDGESVRAARRCARAGAGFAAQEGSEARILASGRSEHSAASVACAVADGDPQPDGVGEVLRDLAATTVMPGAAGEVMTQYRAVGMAKVDGGIGWLLRLLRQRMLQLDELEDERRCHKVRDDGTGALEHGSLKIVVFGHHRSVLDRIHAALLEINEARGGAAVAAGAGGRLSGCRGRGRSVGAEGEDSDGSSDGAAWRRESGTSDGAGGRQCLPEEVKVVRIDGETPTRQRVEILKDYHECSEAAVAIVSVTAGGQGVDLSCASVAVFFEIPPDCGWVRQAEDRLHRRGQESPVVIYYLVAASPPLRCGNRGVMATDERARGRDGEGGEEAGEVVSKLAELDRRRWGAVGRMIRAIGDVTDGPAHSQGLAVQENGKEEAEHLRTKPAEHGVGGSASGGVGGKPGHAGEAGSRASVIRGRGNVGTQRRRQPAIGLVTPPPEGLSAPREIRAVPAENSLSSPLRAVWFRVSRYTGLVHVLVQRSAESEPSALGLTLDSVLLGAADVSDAAVHDWVAAVDADVAAGSDGEHWRLLTDAATTGAGIWEAGRQAYAVFAALPSRRQRMMAGSLTCWRLAAPPRAGLNSDRGRAGTLEGGGAEEGALRGRLEVWGGGVVEAEDKPLGRSLELEAGVSQVGGEVKDVLEPLEPDAERLGRGADGNKELLGVVGPGCVLESEGAPRQSSVRRFARRQDVAQGAAPLPAGGSWVSVSVATGRSGSRGRTVEYRWGFSAAGNPLCKWCMRDLGSQFFHDGALRAQQQRVLCPHDLFCSGFLLSFV